MFRATVVRRIHQTWPVANLQTKAVHQAHPMTLNTIQAPQAGGRVAMMPSAAANAVPISAAIPTTSSSPAQTSDLAEQEFQRLLIVGTVSGQGEGQKIFTTAEAEL